MNEKITAQPPKEERQEVLKEIRQLENRKKILENKQRNEERRVRTRRLIDKAFQMIWDKGTSKRNLRKGLAADAPQGLAMSLAFAAVSKLFISYNLT